LFIASAVASSTPSPEFHQPFAPRALVWRSDQQRQGRQNRRNRRRPSLNLVVPQRFFTHGQSSTGDRHVYASRTRFIPASLLKLFECKTWPVVAPGGAGGAGPRQVRLDVGARMRGMWR